MDAHAKQKFESVLGRPLGIPRVNRVWLIGGTETTISTPDTG